MSLFDDLNRFLEERLDDFLRNNPHLEVYALLEQIKQQEKDTIKLIINLEAQERQLQQQIMTLAQDIQLWHGRVNKAKSVGENELAQEAADREASLLHQGNLLWGQMEGVKKQIIQARELLQEITTKKEQAQEKAATIARNPSQTTQEVDSSTSDQNQSNTYNQYSDVLEKRFQQWETDQEIEEMKQNLGKKP
jgi:uncharacterized protein (TIGR04376 family)